MSTKNTKFTGVCKKFMFSNELSGIQIDLKKFLDNSIQRCQVGKLVLQKYMNLIVF